jgi:hypothetical protein
MFFLLANAMVPGLKIAEIVNGDVFTVWNLLGTAYLVFGSFFVNLRAIANHYTNIEPQREDFFRVLGSGSEVYPTGLYGKMMLRAYSFLLFGVFAQLVWLVFAVFRGTVGVVWTFGYCFLLLMFFLCATGELGLFGKVEPEN